MIRVRSYVAGEWAEGGNEQVSLTSAIDGGIIGKAPVFDTGVVKAYDHAISKGVPALTRLTIHQRSLLLKRLAAFLSENKKELYDISAHSGATRKDAWLDIDGGIGTLYTLSSKSRKELPNTFLIPDGPEETLSKGGTFSGKHVYCPSGGLALHINAFNFPCWAMLEKLASSILAGRPVIIRPATITSYVAHAVAELIVSSSILPEGSFQIVYGNIDPLMDQLRCIDTVSFTGSRSTGLKIKSYPSIVNNSVPFNLEADSINSTILGIDASSSSEEFHLFLQEIVNEMTTKAGQRCTAIRRAIVPEHQMEELSVELCRLWKEIRRGVPREKETQIGPLAGAHQVKEVEERSSDINQFAELIRIDYSPSPTIDPKGAYFDPRVYASRNSESHPELHTIEAFGPVVTLMPYRSVEQAITIANSGGGSLVGSIFSADMEMCRQMALGIAPFHGRIHIVDRTSAKESTGHGSPLPHMLHGGPGRAGGGEELGGIRSIKAQMRRVALQGSPSVLSAVSDVHVKGAEHTGSIRHPFRKYFEELEIGETLHTHRRTVSEADISNFSGVSGDFFYAHADSIAAEQSMFGKRVAHGYFILSAAAGLFVDPAPGPVLANLGLDDLRFVKPVYPGDTIRVILTVRSKSLKEGEGNGVVYWNVRVLNQSDEEVATYILLTLVRSLSAKGGGS